MTIHCQPNPLSENTPTLNKTKGDTLSLIGWNSSLSGRGNLSWFVHPFYRFGCLAHKDFNIIWLSIPWTEGTWNGVFQNRVVISKLDIYAFISPVFKHVVMGCRHFFFNSIAISLGIFNSLFHRMIYCMIVSYLIRFYIKHRWYDGAVFEFKIIDWLSFGIKLKWAVLKLSSWREVCS